MIKRDGFMSEQSNNTFNASFVDEYHFFLKNYLFRLLGIVNYDLKQDNTERVIDSNGTSTNVEKDGNKIYFYAMKTRLFHIDDDPALTEDNLRLARVVIESFFSFSEFRMIDKNKQNSLMSKQRKAKIYNMAIQVGICNWIVGGSNPANAETLLNVLERWSVTTYEGKHVTMGFIINPNVVSSAKIKFDDWISFLSDDCSAVLSDCIHSVFELDANCNFVDYKSISKGNIIAQCELNDRVPLRFTHIIQQFIPEETDKKEMGKVGVFLLTNGDILIAKNGVIRFVKRNMQWINLSYDAFKGALQNFINVKYDQPLLKDAEKLVSCIYASVLDVSFSHTGGIISVVGSEWTDGKTQDSPEQQVLNFSDNLLLDDQMVKEKMRDIICKDFDDINDPTEREKAIAKATEKRLLKRKILKKLVCTAKFHELDRKLRSELIALDGACILSLDGKVYSFGAIIQNESGSTGGARAAAAKKLSRYGMAVKVSTDGYIELYINSVAVYTAK